MSRYAALLLVAIVLLVALTWLLFGGNQINEPFHPIPVPSGSSLAAPSSTAGVGGEGRYDRSRRWSTRRS